MQRFAGRDLTQGAVPGALYRLTAPSLLATSASIVVLMIEIGFIGQLGTSAVAAVTFTFPLTMALTSIALGISIGTSSVIARRVGSGDVEAVRRLATHGLVLVGVVLTLLATLGMATIAPTFTALGASPEVLGLIEGYLLVYYPATVLFTLTMVAGSVMRATGDARVPGAVMTGGALLNLALDPLFIFGLAGLPRLGLTGAAVAMLLSRLVVAGVLLHYMSGRDHLFVPIAHVRDRIGESCREILHVGLPAMATQLIGPVSAAVITRLLANHGEHVVAGFGVGSRIEAVAVIPLFALSGSIGPFVGQNWGARALDRVRAGMRTAYVFSIVWGAVACALLVLSGATLVPLIDDNPAVARATLSYLLFVPASYGLWGVLMMASAGFNSLGKPIPSTTLAFTRMFVVYVPLASVMSGTYGYAGVFGATAFSNALMGVAGYLWFRWTFFGSGAKSAPGHSRT